MDNSKKADIYKKKIKQTRENNKNNQRNNQKNE